MSIGKINFKFMQNKKKNSKINYNKIKNKKKKFFKNY